MFRVAGALLGRAIFRSAPQSAEALIEPVIALRSRRVRFDPIFLSLWTVSVGLGVVTYGIITNWIYQAHLDLWAGTYGQDDDEEENGDKATNDDDDD